MATRNQLPQPPVPLSKNEWYDNTSIGAGVRGETVLGNISNRYMLRNEWHNHSGIGASVRGEVGAPGNISNRYMEDRQLFLRSYQFCRKQTLGERIKRSFDRARRLVWRRMKAVGRARKVIWCRLRSAVVRRRRRLWRFLRRQIQNCSKDSELGKNHYWQYYFIYESPYYVRCNSSSSGKFNCFG
ncbi:hypothetical protein Droror1_Dr00004727 [Drosera rotundifolia]